MSLPPASWIIPTTTTSSTVLVYQRGVWRNISSWMAASSSPSSSSPTIHCSGFSSSSSRVGFSLSSQPASPSDARFSPGRWMPLVDLLIAYFIIKIFRISHPAPPPSPSQVTQRHQPLPLPRFIARAGWRLWMHSRA